MDTLELDADAFYICTEVSPRNYVVQKAIQIDKSQIERMVGGDLEKTAAATGSSSSNSPAASQPPPPPLPVWFTRECKDRLMQVEVPTMNSSSTNPPQIQYYMHNIPQQAPIDIKQQLKNQLEYYFSRDNLMSDKYLRCQMDNEQYVPITVIAGFRKITQLTNDYNLILEALRESNLVEVDERGEKVRPVTKRTTIILREIGKEYKEEVEKMLSGGPPYLDLKYGLNDSWYVTYATEELTQDAFIHLKRSEVMFNSRPICARIKAGGPPSNIDQPPQPQVIPSTQIAVEPTAMEPQLFPTVMDLGHVLSAYGFVPVATYRPSPATPGTTPATSVSQADDDAKTPIVTRHQPFKYNRGGGGAGHNERGGGRGGRKGGPSSNGSNSNHSRYQNYSANPTASTNPDEASSRGSQSNYSNRNNYGNYSWRRNEPRRFRGNGTENSQYRRSHTAQIPPNSKNSYPPLSSSNGDDVNASASSQPQTPVWKVASNADLPPPPVWPAPNHARGKRKDSQEKKEQTDGNITPTPETTASSENGIMENYQATFDRKQSAQSSTSTSYSYEEQAFPSLPKTQSPTEKRAEKPTFSSVAAGRRNQLKTKPVSEAKKSYAEKLKERNSSGAKSGPG